MDKKINALFVQRFMLHYRIDLLERLNLKDNIKVTLLHGDAGHGKFVNYKGKVRFEHLHLKTIFLRKSGSPVVFFPLLFRELRRLSPDVIISEGESNMMNNIIIYLYSLLYGKRIVWWGLGLIPGYKETFFQKIYKPLMLLYLRRSSHIIGYSNYAKDYYSRFVKRDKILVAHNCLDNEKIDLEISECTGEADAFKKEMGLDGRFIILFVGAINPAKSVDRLIYAYKEVYSRHPDASLIIVGEGNQRNSLEELARSLQLKNIIFTGKVIKGTSKYFLTADLFVLPGLGGLSIHHAMIHSLPVIAGSADGTEQDLVLDDQNGYLLKTETVSELAEVMEKFVTDRELSKRFGKKSRDIVDNTINIVNMVNTFVSAIENRGT